MVRKFRILLILMLLGWMGVNAQELPDSIVLDPNTPVADYANPKRFLLKDVRVHGVKYLDTNILAATTGLIKGDSVYMPSNYISQAITKLWNQRYFSDVQIVADIDGDELVLNVFLQERPRVYQWAFDGAKKSEANELKESLKLKRGSELSDYLIAKHSEAIRKFYSEKGFRNTEVSVKIDNDTTIQNAVNVTFVIDKKSKVKIGAIDFEGNEVYKDKRLRAAMKKTHQKDWKFWQGAKLKETDYEADKENILDFYNERGYRNATIVYDTLYVISPKRIGIRIGIEEGNKYYYRNISWVGNSKYSTEELQMMLGLEPGDSYDKKTLQKRLGIGKEGNPEDMSITSLYQNDGYLFFQVDPAEVIIGEDSIDLELKIFEGKQATINEVTISGNLRVDDEVIRRELYTHPGELYNRSLLMATIRQLGQMGHFNPEAIMPVPSPVSNELVDIAWPLEEQASDQVEISGGWGANMFVGSVALTLNNLSLRNFFKKGTWRPYPQGQNQQLSIRAQSNGQYYKSFSLSFTEPWLGGRKPNSLTVSAYYSEETNSSYIWQTSSKHFRTLGMSVGLGRRLKWPDQYFTLYHELSYQSYNLKDWDYFIISNGSSNIVSLRTVLGRNSVDQMIYPRRGSDISLSLTLTPPYSLLDGRDYKNTGLKDRVRYRWIEYHKWLFKSQWYYPLSRNNNLVLMAKAEMGYIGYYNKYKQSPFEGFDVGGDGMSGYNLYGVDIIGVRGYEDGALTPVSIKNDYARVYNKYVVEMRYPFILKPSSTIYGLVFVEGGNAFKSIDEFNPLEIKRSVGLGVRLYLPVVGMIGLDWGYGLDKAVRDNKRSGGQFHFIMGMQF